MNVVPHRMNHLVLRCIALLLFIFLLSKVFINIVVGAIEMLFVYMDVRSKSLPFSELCNCNEDCIHIAHVEPPAGVDMLFRVMTHFNP